MTGIPRQNKDYQKINHKPKLTKLYVYVYIAFLKQTVKLVKSFIDFIKKQKSLSLSLNFSHISKNARYLLLDNYDIHTTIHQICTWYFQKKSQFFIIILAVYILWLTATKAIDNHVISCCYDCFFYRNR